MSTYWGRGRGRGRGNFARHHGPASRPVSDVPIRLNKPGVPTQVPTKPTNDLSNRITFNLDLDLTTEQWFAQFRNLWNLLKRNSTVTNMLCQHLKCVQNPYEEALRLMYNSLDFKNAKSKSLSMMVMEEFKIFSTLSRDSIIHLLTTDVKISAFNIVRMQSQFQLMKLVSEIYEMMTDCDIFLDIINQMIQNCDYKDACQCSMVLGLHSKFGIDEFLVPLILQDKLVVVEEFLADSPQHQCDVVSFLDTILGQPSSIRAALDQYITKFNVREVKWVKLNYKPWRKLIVRLVKMYNLPSDVTPCLNKKRNEGALSFLLNKRFVDNSFGYESWREMVEEAVRDDKSLQRDLVTQIAMFGDAAEALMWANYYNIPREYWPYSVRLFSDNPDEDRHQQKDLQVPSEENWDTPEPKIDYLKLDLPHDRIILIDTVDKFEKFLMTIKNEPLVGVDCEWKPSFGVQRNELALMQIASRRAVYILDTIALAHLAPPLWQELGKSLFNNCDVLKLGFSFTGDTSMILQSLPNLSFSQSGGFVDLLCLWKKVEKNPRVKLPHQVQSGGPSLSTLVQVCLGRPLDKSDQFSNWEKRPLRQTQLEYAALDAYCLIQIYDVLQQCSEAVGFPFEETCCHLMTVPKGKKKKSKTNIKTKEGIKLNPQPPSPHYETRSADRIAFVCDTMLQGLGKALRKCGIDAVILENNSDHKECVRHYQNDQRYILTRGTAFNTLMGYVSPGHCFNIQSDDVDEQLKKVLEYFNVVVTKDHVFSRCQACNSNCFVKVSKSTIKDISIESRKPKRLEYEEMDLVDEATGFSSSDDDYDLDACGPPISYSRKWQVCSEDKIDLGLCMTRNGVKIQIQDVPDAVIDKHDLFYICEDCGKVYWDGTHFEKALSNKLKGIVIS